MDPQSYDNGQRTKYNEQEEVENQRAPTRSGEPC